MIRRAPGRVSTALTASCVAIVYASLATPSLAQSGGSAPVPSTQQSTDTPSAAQDDTAGPAPETNTLDEIVVTGVTSRNRTVLTSSAAITVVNAEELLRKAPRSTAQALELVPGIFVEASGGEVSNNFSVRGLAGGGQRFIQISEDGLPVFYTNSLSDTLLRQDITIDRLEAVRGGTSGILTVNGAGATINFITRKPDFDKSTGSFRLTTSSFETKRVDAFYTMPITDNLAFSVGGFFRSADSVRDTGFTADEGYLVRGALAYRFANDGRLSINFRRVNDRNTFLTPIPIQNADRPESIPGLSATRGTLIGPDVSRFTVRTSPLTGALTKDVDLAGEGVHTRGTSVGYDFEMPLTDAFTLFSRGRYTDFKNDFNANFSFDNNSLEPAVNRLNPPLDPRNDTRTSATTRLLLNTYAPLGATRAALRVVSTGEIIDGAAALGALNGNGLIAENVTANNISRREEYATDTGLRWDYDGGDIGNSLTVGALYFNSDLSDNNFGASTFLSDVRDNSRRLDIVALNAAGQVVGQLTENSLLSYGVFGEGGSFADQSSLSIYANDELRIGEKLRIDGGIRYERFKIRRLENDPFDSNAARNDPAQRNTATPIPGAFDAAGNDVDNILANNYYAQFGGGAFSGDFIRQNETFNEFAYTIGVNYLFQNNFAGYGRYARGFQTNGQNEPTKLDFAEVGVRYSTRAFSASLTGFYTKFYDYLESRQVAGDATVTFLTSDIEVWGGEFDVRVQPVDWFRLQANGVLQRPRIKGGQFGGNRPERSPEVNITVTPSIILPDDMGEVYLTYRRIGKIFSDPANSLRLPGYDVLSTGFLVAIAPQVDLTLSIDNLTNEIGLTEGNPRAGFAENSGSGFYFARPILGRNAVASLTFNF